VLLTVTGGGTNGKTGKGRKPRTGRSHETALTGDVMSKKCRETKESGQRGQKSEAIYYSDGERLLPASKEGRYLEGPEAKSVRIRGRVEGNVSANVAMHAEAGPEKRGVGETEVWRFRKLRVAAANEGSTYFQGLKIETTIGKISEKFGGKGRLGDLGDKQGAARGKK